MLLCYYAIMLCHAFLDILIHSYDFLCFIIPVHAGASPSYDSLCFLMSSYAFLCFLMLSYAFYDFHDFHDSYDS